MQKGRYGTPTRLGSFKAHCEEKGYELLKEDYTFIDQQLVNVPVGSFKAVLRHYLDEWSNAMAESKNASSAQGEGRRRANIWLREYCDKVREERQAKAAGYAAQSRTY